jgi:uncharacterized protein (DUF2141 family)
MKLICRLAVIAGLAAFAAPAFAEDLTIKLLGVEARGGKVLVAVYTQAEFQKKPAYTAMADAPAKKGEVVVTIKNVAPGTYSFSALHDENGDMQMQRNPNGMPAEGWSAVNGDFLRGPPTFDDTKFVVAAGKPFSITEMMHYSGRVP